MMRMEQQMTPEMAIGQIQEDVQQIRDDLDVLRAFVTGGGDPTKGLLWLAADLARMVASLTSLVDEQRKSLIQYAEALSKHEGLSAHERRDSPWWQRLAYDAARQAAAIAVSAVLLLLLLGTQTWIRTQ